MPKQSLIGLFDPASPVVGPLTALQAMKKSPVTAVMRAQDAVVTTGRRIVASGGMHGSIVWRVPNSNPTQEGGARTHPAPDSESRVHEFHLDVTPGCFLQLVAAVLPSGQTQIPDGSGGWFAGGAVGFIRVNVQWYDRAGNDVTTSHVVNLPPSQDLNGAAPTEPGGFFAALKPVVLSNIRPPIPNLTEQQRWSRHVTARVEVIYQGAPRVVDWSIHEVPQVYALRFDDPADLWCSHMYGNGSPSANPNQFNHPWVRRAATDQRYGTEHLMNVQLAQRLRLGPHLVHWSPHSEGSGTPSTAIEHVEFDNTGGFVNLLNVSQTAYDEEAPGWSVSCGGYARRWDDNGDHVLRNRIATVPVYVWCFASHVGTGSSTFRFQTGPFSYIDVPIGAGPFGFAYGHLRVGLSPEQPVVGQAFVRHEGDAELIVGAFGVCRADQWAPAYTG